MRPLPRMTVRRLMLGVGIAAVALFLLRGVWRFAESLIDSPYGLGRTTALLSPGQPAILAGDYPAAPSGQSIQPTGRAGDKSTMYSWGATSKGDYAVAHGTPCIVEIDPAWDVDCCYDDRPIAVKLTGGQHRGASVAIPRRLLPER